MNPRLAAHYHDGRRLAPRPVEIEFAGDDLLVHGLGQPLAHPLAAVRISDRLARVPRFLLLPDGASLETPENDAIDAQLRFRRTARGRAFIHWLEQHTRIAAAATVLLVLTVAAAVHYGLPALAHRGAHAVPDNIEQQAGRLALESLDRFLGPSALDFTARQRVLRQSERLQRTLQLPVPPQIEFRAMGVHPNAFALPGGIIVVSDELVRMANDDELSAVLAHEIAHWRLRHGLQGLLRGSAALLLVCTVTGDLSTLTTFAGTIPVVLLQRGYSREFEQEADDHAVEMLRRAKIDPRYLASILGKLESRRSTGGQDFSYLSTHPATKDRIAKISPSADSSTHAVKPTASTVDHNAIEKSVAPPSPAAAFSPRSADQSAIESDSALTLADLVARSPRPTVTRRIAPIYPASAYHAGRIGRVTIQFSVDRHGEVSSSKVTSSTSEEFESAALAAVVQWRFTANSGDKRVHHAFDAVFAFEPEDIYSADEWIVWATSPDRNPN